MKNEDGSLKKLSFGRCSEMDEWDFRAGRRRSDLLKITQTLWEVSQRSDFLCVAAQEGRCTFSGIKGKQTEPAILHGKKVVLNYFLSTKQHCMVLQRDTRDELTNSVSFPPIHPPAWSYTGLTVFYLLLTPSTYCLESNWMLWINI